MKSSDRLHALDAVRAFALLLGVFHHATLSFIAGSDVAAIAPVQDASPSVPLAALAFIGHMFRMPLFFMVAGFFARLSVERKGAAGFARDRAQRIALPLVVAWLLFFPLISIGWSEGRTHTLFQGSLFPASLSIARFPVSYLWFLYYLLMIYVLALGFRAFVRLADRAGSFRNAADHIVRTVFGHPWLAPALLALLLAAGLLSERGAVFLTGLPTPNDTLIPRLLPLCAYTIAFALGWMLHRNVELLWRWQHRWVAHLIVAVLATLLCVALVETRSQPSNELTSVGRVLFAGGYALASWCWVIAITGFALRFLSGANATRRYLADASYWIYLVHYPIVVTLQDFFAPRPIHWLVKFPAIVAITLAISLLTYHFFVRFTSVGRILNGRRHVPSGVTAQTTPAQEVLRR